MRIPVSSNIIGGYPLGCNSIPRIEPPLQEVSNMFDHYYFHLYERMQFVALTNGLRLKVSEHYDNMEFGVEAFSPKTKNLVFEGHGKTFEQAMDCALKDMQKWLAKN